MANVVKFSDDELMLLTGTSSLAAGLTALKAYNIDLVVVTQGAKGALVVTSGTEQLVAGEAVKPVDTTGAGDAFVGGLLCKLAAAEEWQTFDAILAAVKWANGCGALATTKKGAMTALPDEQSLLRYIR
jgi:fructokinase